MSFYINVSCAQHFVLHSAVGDTINQEEKQQFVLFSDVPDNDMLFAVMDSTEHYVELHVTMVNGNKLTQQYIWSEIAELKKQVDKLVAYYSGNIEMEVQPSILTQKDTTISLAGKLIDEQSQEEINKAVRRDVKINQDATRQQLYKEGLESSPGSIELFSGGKRKKKKN